MLGSTEYPSLEENECWPESNEDDLVLAATCELSVPDQNVFRGACIDSGLQQTIIDSNQAKAYCMQYGGTITSSPVNHTYRFGKYFHVDTGSKICTPVSNTYVVTVKAEVFDANAPLLIGLDILSDLNALLDIGNNKISSPERGWEALLARRLSYLHVEWLPAVFFTTAEMRKIHRHFLHAHPEKVFEVLRRADPDGVAGEDLENLQRIRRKCDVCQRMADAPRRFRVALPGTDCVFNRYVCLDLMSTESQSGLYVVEMVTKYSAACFLSGEKSSNICKALLKILVNAYVGYPDLIAVDQGPQFTIGEWATILVTHGIAMR